MCFSCQEEDVKQIFVPHGEYINICHINRVSYQLEGSRLTLYLETIKTPDMKTATCLYLKSPNVINSHQYQDILRSIRGNLRTI